LSDHGTEREKFSLALEISYYNDEDDSAQADLTTNAWARARFLQLEQNVRTNRILGQTALPDSVIFDPETGYAVCVAT
jgi:hypothetical protein